jgi:uncharacterized membrane protein YfcA
MIDALADPATGWALAGTCIAFSLCVGLASFAQNLTGFAFALILLGVVSVLHLASVADAANAATVLTLVNAAVYFRLHHLPPQWRVMQPALLASIPGVVLGVALLAWLSGTAVDALRALLGVVIIACAALLMLQSRPRSTLSGKSAFAFSGAISGVLSGLFSAPGPPLVYHMYRQPLDQRVVRECLLLMFAGNAALRLVLIVAGGHFSLRSMLLSACAVPMVYAMTRLHQRRPPTLSPSAMRRLVGALLVATGISLCASAMRALG